MKSKIICLSKNDEFKEILKGRKNSNKYFTIFFKKLTNKSNKKLNISFVAKKKLGNAVKRNKIKRKLKAAIQKNLKQNNVINLNYTYLVLGKKNLYKDKFSLIFNDVNNVFKKIK